MNLNLATLECGQFYRLFCRKGKFSLPFYLQSCINELKMCKVYAFLFCISVMNL